MKSYSIKYISVISVIIVLFLVFFTSKSWMPTDREMREENYNTIFEIDCWTFKINNAIYNKTEKTISFDMYQYTKMTDVSEPDYTIYLGKKSSQKEPLTFEVSEISPPDTADNTYDIFAKHVVVKNIPKSYWYISVNFSCIPYYTTTTSESTTIDVFGFENIVEKLEPQSVEKKVQIDYRNVINEEK